MEQVFRGSSIRKEAFSALSEAYTDFAQIYKDLGQAATHAKAKAQAFKDGFLENLFDLLSFQVPNLYEVTYHGKPLKSHSLGQRASAMMLFLLKQEDNDLFLIDQPEDDLDSQTVYEEVVKLLRVIKSKHQFVYFCHTRGKFSRAWRRGERRRLRWRRQSHRSSLRKHRYKRLSKINIVSIMEGGVEAFDRRKTIYQIWKAG